MKELKLIMEYKKNVIKYHNACVKVDRRCHKFKKCSECNIFDKCMKLKEMKLNQKQSMYNLTDYWKKAGLK